MDERSVDMLMYHDALQELARATRSFSAALIHAAHAAQRAGGVDDLVSVRVFQECRAHLGEALRAAPGFLDVIAKAA